MKNKLSMKSLDHYLKVKHTRYITAEAEEELRARTPKCDAEATNPERLFWILENLSDYPSCKACSKKLSSFHWEPFLKVDLRPDDHKDRKSGYRPFCSRECSYNFEGQKKKKYEQTSLARFGVPHPMRSKEVIAKIKQTNVAKYGTDWPMAWNGEAFSDALLMKHGVRAVRHISGVSGKIAETKLEQSRDQLVELVQKNEQDFDVKCVSEVQLGDASRIDAVNLTWEHSCGFEYDSRIRNKKIKRCPECFISRSKAEQDLGDYIESLGFEVVRNDRSIIKPRELDIYIPSKKIAIEFDGTYWHSAQFEDKKQSTKKLDLCDQAGIRLITVQEGYWIRNNDIIKSRLKSVLGLCNREFARHCDVRIIDSSEGANFLRMNHLHGSARARVYYGLFKNEELIAVMSFGAPRWRKSEKFELIRFATKLGVTVVGGASKILKRFRKENPGSIVSYADRCWSSGALYEALGFKLSHISSPSYWWVSEKLGIYSRYQTQKAKLGELLLSLNCKFDPRLSEFDNMEMNGFLQVFDRGNSVWILD